MFFAMNFDELKQAWQATDAQLQATRQLQIRLVSVLIQDRSHSRLTALRRYLAGSAALAFVYAAAVGGVLAGNVLGLRQWYSLALLGALVLMALGMGTLLLRERYRIGRLALHTGSLRAALEAAIATHQRFISLFGRVAEVAALLVFGVIGARLSEHLHELSRTEALTAGMSVLFFAVLTARYFRTTAARRVNAQYRSQVREWQQELAELSELTS